MSQADMAVAEYIGLETSLKAKVLSLTEADERNIFLAELEILNGNPETFTALKNFIDTYLMFGDVGYRSGSTPIAFGTILLGEKVRAFQPKELAVSIVHEMAHQELFLIQLLDRLIEEEADFRLVHAPFQGRKRPPIGRLHSFFALFRMVQFERQASIADAHHAQLLFDTAATFAEGELTLFGEKLVETAIRAVKSNFKKETVVSA